MRNTAATVPSETEQLVQASGNEFMDRELYDFMLQWQSNTRFKQCCQVTGINHNKSV